LAAEGAARIAYALVLVFGGLHVLDEAMCEVPTGQTGKFGFQTASPELPRLQTGKLYDALLRELIGQGARAPSSERRSREGCQAPA
jgi:hypothetical protein